MKNSIQFLAAAALVLGMSSTIKAQNSVDQNLFDKVASAKSSASATIVCPRYLVNIRGIHFGVISKSAIAGTVTVNPETGIAAPSAGVIHFGGEYNGEYELYGEATANYDLTLPTTALIFNSNAADSMLVDNFTAFTQNNAVVVTNNTIGSSAGTTDANGKDIILTGARLNVGANQTAGFYTGTYVYTATFQ